MNFFWNAESGRVYDTHHPVDILGKHHTAHLYECYYNWFHSEPAQVIRSTANDSGNSDVAPQHCMCKKFPYWLAKMLRRNKHSSKPVSNEQNRWSPDFATPLLFQHQLDLRWGVYHRLQHLVVSTARRGMACFCQLLHRVKSTQSKCKRE